MYDFNYPDFPNNLYIESAETFFSKDFTVEYSLDGLQFDTHSIQYFFNIFRLWK